MFVLSEHTDCCSSLLTVNKVIDHENLIILTDHLTPDRDNLWNRKSCQNTMDKEVTLFRCPRISTLYSIATLHTSRIKRLINTFDCNLFCCCCDFWERLCKQFSLNLSHLLFKICYIHHSTISFSLFCIIVVFIVYSYIVKHCVVVHFFLLFCFGVLSLL